MIGGAPLATALVISLIYANEYQIGTRNLVRAGNFSGGWRGYIKSYFSFQRGAGCGVFARRAGVGLWGDYGEEAPSFFGVQLGTDIRNYPGMKSFEGEDRSNPVSYYREADKDASLAGITLRKNLMTQPGRVAYRTYNNIICEIYFDLDLKDFVAFRNYMDLVYGNMGFTVEIYNAYQWGLYGTVITAFGFFPPSPYADYGSEVEYDDAVKGYNELMLRNGSKDFLTDSKSPLNIVLPSSNLQR